MRSLFSKKTVVGAFLIFGSVLFAGATQIGNSKNTLDVTAHSSQTVSLGCGRGCYLWPDGTCTCP